MHTMEVVITKFVDPHQPGFVECALTDAWGREWLFVEKVPVVTTAPLDEWSAYPQPGTIACEIVRRWRDAGGRELVTVDTERPSGVQSATGQTRFDLPAGQVRDDGAGGFGTQ